MQSEVWFFFFSKVIKIDQQVRKNTEKCQQKLDDLKMQQIGEDKVLSAILRNINRESRL